MASQYTPEGLLATTRYWSSNTISAAERTYCPDLAAADIARWSSTFFDSGGYGGDRGFPESASAGPSEVPLPGSSGDRAAIDRSEGGEWMMRSV
ncbi:hypothetical protein C4D60_Mb08t34100 [Musa balbisiana]|uniref:Uncharacterized protein n=1 Tax=Musa balbisiana TaxID=52838 RepID=A0A4S8K8L7_MUSBA|nr:hypothetical protein C4D60_Mb08t34100 [Musa balbisiana]